MIKIYSLSVAMFVLSVVTSSVFAESDIQSAHPFQMSKEINTATIKAMKPDQSSVKSDSSVTIAAKQGKVVEVINAKDFSYLYIETKERKIWIAGIKAIVKVGDIVNYIESVTMDNFHSKSLNRTFDKVVFVSSVSVAR